MQLKSGALSCVLRNIYTEEGEDMLETVIGKQGKAERTVGAKDTAASAASGLLPVFATPAMIALMEEAAYLLVQPFLDEGCSTVGTAVDVAHTSATPMGYRVWAEATLTAAEGRVLKFDVAAFDEAGEIGRGTHTRAIIDEARFLGKLNTVKPAK